MSYDVFISYPHDEDRIAPTLHDALQRFAKPWWQRRAMRVFIDRASLSANPGLWSSIAEAMDSADWMVLLASPAAASSNWVNREITYWLKRHGASHLLIVLIDGELRWDRARSDFDLDSSAVPDALRDVFSEEPRHVDLRWARDNLQLNLHNPKFRDQIAEIAAPIRGLTKEEIEGTDLREHRRFRRTVAVLATVLGVLTITAIISSIWATRSAHQASARTADADFDNLVAQARNVSGSDPTLAMLLAVQATRLRNNSQSESALLATLSSDLGFDGEIVDSRIGSGFTGVCLTEGGRVAVAGSDSGAVIADVDEARVVGAPVRFGPPHSGGYSVACSRDGSTVFAFDQAGYWTQIDVKRHRVLGQLHHYAHLYDLAVSANGHVVALSNNSGYVALSTLDVGGVGSTIIRPERSPCGLAFSPDGTSLATISSGGVKLWSLPSLTLRWTVNSSELGAISATPRTPLLSVTRDHGNADFSPDGKTLAESSGSQLLLIDVATGHKIWSRPTAWYDGSQVQFSGDGRLLVNLTAGEIQQVNTTNGAPIGAPISPQGGISVDFAVSGHTVVSSSNASSELSIFDLDPNGPITRAVRDPSGRQLIEYNPSGRSLLLQLEARTGSPPIFSVTRTFNPMTGSSGPKLPELAQPRFLGAELVGGMQGSFTIGEFNSTTARQVGDSIHVKSQQLLHLTNAQVDSRTHRILLANNTGTLDLISPSGKPLASPWADLGGYLVLSTDGFAANGSIAVFRNGGDQTVWVLNSRGQQILRKSISVTMAALSPDGGQLAVLHGQQVDLFSVRTGRQIGIPIGVPGGLTDLEFSRDGRRMLVFGESQGVVINLSDDQLLGDSFSSTGYLALRPDGNQLAAVSGGWILLWNLDSSTWPEAACHAAGRNLTQAEWSHYLPAAGPYQRTCPQWPDG